jgi:hypothetical protein
MPEFSSRYFINAGAFNMDFTVIIIIIIIIIIITTIIITIKS